MTLTQQLRDDYEALTVAEVAGLLKVSTSQVRKLAASGVLRGTRVGNQWRFLPRDLDTFWGKP